MKKTFGLLMLIALVSLPAAAQKVAIDYAHDFDFSSVKTFAYVDTAESNADNPLMAERVRNMIIQRLEDGGLEQVESDADLYVTYHYHSKENVSYSTTGFGYGGYGAGWYGWGGGMGSTTTTATTYEVGTLVIDAYEPVDKKMVWRGMGTVDVKNKPEKQIKQVENILNKLGKRWQKILAGEGK